MSNSARCSGLSSAAAATLTAPSASRDARNVLENVLFMTDRREVAIRHDRRKSDFDRLSGAPLQSLCDRLRTRARAELAEQRLDVKFHRVQGNPQVPRDRLVAQARTDCGKHIELARGQQD